jgi:CMP-N,N'-diacetyllegionaminic acid synthase
MKPWDNIGSFSFIDGEALAVVPARGGSKGLKRKCMKLIGETPLLVRAVQNCLAATTVTRVVLSTDDTEFADAGRNAGAEVPYLRAEHLAADNTSTIDVLDELLLWVAKTDNVLPEFLLLNQPTTPLLITADYDNAFQRLSKGVDAVCSVCESEINPDWMRRIGNRGYLVPLGSLDVPQHAPRQEMPITYRLNGGLYWIRTKVFLSTCSMLPSKTVHYEMPAERSVDVDTEIDLVVANALFNTLGLGDNDTCKPLA